MSDFTKLEYEDSFGKSAHTNIMWGATDLCSVTPDTFRATVTIFIHWSLGGHAMVNMESPKLCNYKTFDEAYAAAKSVVESFGVCVSQEAAA